MYYKSEAYIGSEFAGKYLYENGLTPVYVSDNPVLNAQHVLFEAAKAYHYGLPYHAALASVTTAPAEELGMGQRIGKIKPGYDADVVVWDSDPLSVGAAPVQVWIDGTSQLHDPIELSKRRDGPLVADESLSHVEEPRETSAALFRGVNKVLLSGNKTYERDGERSLNVAFKNGKISCIGHCGAEFATARASGVEVVSLKNGYLTDAFTGVAGNLGLGEIDAEPTTENGNNAVKFTRAIDGLQLGGKKLRVGARYGVTRAISAPKLNNLGTHHGTSVGFVTTARTSLEKGAVFAQDVAVHYTVDVNSRAADSYSAAFGELRRKLLRAAKGGEDVADAYSEAAYLQKVVEGTMVLALTVNSADGIATALRIKAEVEGALRSSSSSSSSSSRKLRLAIIGGAESHLVAAELAAASVGVILLPLQATALTWDARRTLPGAPLTNGTAVDWLVAAGVTVAVGLPEDWRVRDLGFEAGVAYRNGNGRISEKAALDMVSINVHTILDAKADEDAEGAGDAGQGHFMVSEGSPLEIGSRIKAVGTGRGSILAFGV
ncbi:hypothetical protein DCS_03178 [Drechmeria coniospora]|uniref:Amidohydrolase 3 domain-containing protein n=1 Tax=Drechmeria coniospora TaxID=98403 RepID=A0A151GYB2_DRECN|nr:hypothetical protein DCS_03178 [Drechmeria coniospora]KYK62033.1 hypothetical protein DCS_03178 [Drechmeria coniospora]